MAGRIFQTLIWGLVAFSLAGCALPPAVQAISYAADAISLLGSGKSVTDHALSAAVGEDCALLRALQDEDICAHRENAATAPLKTETARTETAIVETAMAQTAPALKPTNDGAISTKFTAPASNAFTLLGLYRSPVSADMEADKYRYLGAQVVETSSRKPSENGEILYAVTTRLSSARALAAGNHQARTVYLCEGQYFYRNICTSRR